MLNQVFDFFGRDSSPPTNLLDGVAIVQPPNVHLDSSHCVLNRAVFSCKARLVNYLEGRTSDVLILVRGPGEVPILYTSSPSELISHRSPSPKIEHLSCANHKFAVLETAFPTM